MAFLVPPDGEKTMIEAAAPLIYRLVRDRPDFGCGRAVEMSLRHRFEAPSSMPPGRPRLAVHHLVAHVQDEKLARRAGAGRSRLTEVLRQTDPSYPGSCEKGTGSRVNEAQMRAPH